jgi:CheY-like chemotaxis protein
LSLATLKNKSFISGDMNRRMDNGGKLTGPDQFRLTVVAVDDEPDILTIIKKSLELHGFSVEVFTDAKSALEFIHSVGRKPEQAFILLSDVRMPGINGFELVRTVRAFCPSIAIVLMTAFEIDNKEFSKVMPSTPVDGFLSKPFTLERLKLLVIKMRSIVESQREGQSSAGGLK